jgi:uncharacterized alkaline shock family protein YloU
MVTDNKARSAAGIDSAATRPPDTIDTEAVRRIAVDAARDITGVGRDVQVRVKLVRGEAALALKLPVHYPMPIWQVATACRAHVRSRLSERAGIKVRRVDIEVTDLSRKAL